MGPGSNMTSVFIRRQPCEVRDRLRECHVAMKAEAGVMHL